MDGQMGSLFIPIKQSVITKFNYNNIHKINIKYPLFHCFNMVPYS